MRRAAKKVEPKRLPSREKIRKLEARLRQVTGARDRLAKQVAELAEHLNQDRGETKRLQDLVTAKDIQLEHVAASFRRAMLNVGTVPKQEVNAILASVGR